MTSAGQGAGQFPLKRKLLDLLAPSGCLMVGTVGARHRPLNWSFGVLHFTLSRTEKPTSLDAGFSFWDDPP